MSKNSQVTYYVAFMHANGHGHTVVASPTPIVDAAGINRLHKYLTDAGVVDPTVINFIPLGETATGARA
ncbi:hypothetical protein [Pilimelia columellifera]|uniref:Uncharacterized protein n=1 Tax=Pilimelia columellifera subsp. columellifera TaxID=706583 RepID=A0ABP6A983_9ACTN